MDAPIVTIFNSQEDKIRNLIWDFIKFANKKQNAYLVQKISDPSISSTGIKLIDGSDISDLINEYVINSQQKENKK